MVAVVGERIEGVGWASPEWMESEASSEWTDMLRLEEVLHWKLL